MKYQTSSYSEFKEVYNFLPNLQKLLIEVFPNSSFEEQKLDKEFFVNLYTNQYVTETGDSLFNKLSMEIKNNYKFNDFSQTYLPLKGDKTGGKITFNTLLLEGMREKTNLLSDNDKLNVWAEIIAYLSFSLIRESGVQIVFEHTLSEEIPIIQKINSKFTVSENQEAQLQIERKDYIKSRKEIEKQYEQNFDWFIDTTLFRNYWDDKDFCINKMKNSFCNIEFVDKKLFENVDFVTEAIELILNKISNYSYSRYSTDYSDIHNRFMANKQDFLKYLDILLKELPDSYINIENVDKFIQIYNYQKKQSESNFIESQRILFSMIEKFLNTDIENIDYEKISNFYKKTEFISIENLKKDKILKELCESINSIGERSSVLADFFGVLNKRDNNLLTKEIVLKVFKQTNIKNFYVYGSTQEKLKSLFKNINEKEYLSIIETNTNLLGIVGRPKFKITEDFLNKVSDLSKSVFFSLMNEEYLVNNYNKVLQISNYEGEDLNEENFNKYVDKNDKELLLNIIKNRTRLPDFLSKLTAPQFYKDNELDVDIIKYMSANMLYEIMHYKKGKLITFFKNISEENKDILLEENSHFYKYLPESKKINKKDAINFLKSIDKDDYNTNFWTIPGSLSKDKEFCLELVKEFLNNSEKSIYIKSIPPEFWNNKDFILKVAKELDSHTTGTINQLVNLLPKNIEEFFTKFEIKPGEYHDFMSSYMSKQELKNLLTEPVQAKRVNKL